MSPADARRALLCAELAHDFAQVEALLTKVRRTDPRQGEAESALVALSLDRAYQAFESLLVRLERELGLPARGGDSWHVLVLADAALAVPGLRPAVVPAAAQHHWEALRRFRHFLRHAYAVELDPERLRELGEHLGQAVALTGPEVSALLTALAA